MEKKQNKKSLYCIFKLHLYTWPLKIHQTLHYDVTFILNLRISDMLTFVRKGHQCESFIVHITCQISSVINNLSINSSVASGAAKTRGKTGAACRSWWWEPSSEAVWSPKWWLLCQKGTHGGGVCTTYRQTPPVARVCTALSNLTDISCIDQP